MPRGIDPDGRERLEFIPGDVAVPPYPAWVQTDAALTSIARLLRSLHDASEGLDLDGLGWSDELADPQAGPVICHNDVCLENVVFRDGEATALLDLDFAAPGRRVHDVASFARKCVPVDDPTNAARLGWRPADRPARTRLVADAYGLDAAERGVMLAGLEDSMDAGEALVRRRVSAGDPGFVRMWDEGGGGERFERRRAWWSEERRLFAEALA